MTGTRRTRTGWSELILTSGLAALIATAGSYLTDNTRSARDTQTRRCELAQTVLSDEAPNPYMDERARSQVVRTAVTVFDACMKER